MAHSGAWDGVAHALSDRLHLVAPDLVGHGRGPAWDRAQDFHDQTTEAACGHLPKAPCHLIGHSFGATVALRLALEHPDRVWNPGDVPGSSGHSKGRPCRLPATG